MTWGMWKLQSLSDPSGSEVKSNTMVEEEIMVGFEDEAITIKERLTEAKKQLEIISIVGMPGLGKTTLARHVYNDSYIMHHFHIRAWANFSQKYRKEDVLLDIFQCVAKFNNEIEFMSAEKLGEVIYKRLKGKVYLIVLDDVWSAEAWDDVKTYLPNDNNGSRVMFTSRLVEVCKQTKPESRPHYLRLLRDEESWELLQKKVSLGNSDSEELTDLGKQIASKCEGLPLAIVVIAGFLAKEKKTRDKWEQVADSVSSYIVADQNQYMNTLGLSYYHLPNHLKPCFLYFGAFLEGREIPVRKLIWLWISEGFIWPMLERRERGSLEEIAEDYLTDLTERSLVLVSQKRSKGGIKACRMHDLLRILCLREADESNFLAWIHKKNTNEHSSIPFSSSSDRTNNPSRLCIPYSKFELSSIECYARSIQSIFLIDDESSRASLNSYATSVRPIHSINGSFLGEGPIPSLRNSIVGPIYSHTVSLFDMNCDSFPWLWVRQPVLSFVDSSGCQRDKHQSFKPRVLDLCCLQVFFSFQCSELVFLRYLAIQIDEFFVIPPSIKNLSNLETFILGTQAGSHFVLPQNIWEMVKLRHLYTRGTYHIKDWHPYELAGNKQLQTLSNLCPCGHVWKFLPWAPNLRKLGLRGNLISESNHLTFPGLHYLPLLETLKLDHTMLTWSTNLLAVEFPANVRKLTLRGMGIKWEHIWVLGKLRNLEVLKLERRACLGLQWRTADGGFRRLKFLKLKCLGLVEWFATSTHFPGLQHLVLEECYSLQKIPPGFGDIPVLRIIEVTCCLSFAEESARQIKRRQEHNGDNWLKILINNRECFGMTCGSETESMGSASEEQ